MTTVYDLSEDTLQLLQIPTRLLAILHFLEFLINVQNDFIKARRLPEHDGHQGKIGDSCRLDTSDKTDRLVELAWDAGSEMLTESERDRRERPRLRFDTDVTCPRGTLEHL